MARAFAFAMGSGPPPKEWRLKKAVENYGTEAVFGRQLYTKEINTMDIVDRIVLGYYAKIRSGDWAKWEQNNKELASLIDIAAGLAIEMGMVSKLE